MATVRAVCPYCARPERLAVSTPVTVYSDRHRREWLDEAPIGQISHDAIAPWRSPPCARRGIGLFSSDANAGQGLLQTGIDVSKPVEESGVAELLLVFPRPETVLVPESVPPGAREFYLEAREDLQRRRNAAGVISKCRSVL